MSTRSRSSFRGLFLSLAAIACEVDQASDTDGVDVEDTEADETEGDGMTFDDSDELEAPFGPQAAGGDPYPYLLPFRADDLRPHEVYSMSFTHSGSDCHGFGCPIDIFGRRWDTGSSSWQATKHSASGTSVDQHVMFGRPMYAVTEGEVIACWRNYPDAPDFDDNGQNCQCNTTTDAIDCNGASGSGWTTCSSVMRSGGNVIVVDNGDGTATEYAHLEQGTIPSELCPNNPDRVFPVNSQPATNSWFPWEYLTCPVGTAGGVCTRPTVSRGQFLGRVGHSGNSGQPHAHLAVRETQLLSNNNYSQGASRDLVSVGDWVKLASQAGLEAWADLFGSSYLDVYGQNGSLVLWPGHKQEETYSGSYRMADFDGNSEDDLVCHGTVGGGLLVDFAWNNQLAGTNGSFANNWCWGDAQRLHTGDFNGDGRGDLLCIDESNGHVWVDYANGSGQFFGTNASITNTPVCVADTQQLFVGDFDGDGDDDLYCHSYADDGLRMLWEAVQGQSLPFYPWVYPASFGDWCYGWYHRLHIGDFNDDGRDDLMCHDTRSGQIYFDHASLSSPVFSGTDVTRNSWCSTRGQRLFVGQFNGSGADDLLCHDSDTGKIWADVGAFGNNDFTGSANGFCSGYHERLRIGDVSGDGRDDLVCFDQLSGVRSIDFASSTVASMFGGMDWTSLSFTDEENRYWCAGSSLGLH